MQAILKIFILFLLASNIFAEDTIHNLPLGDSQYCWDQRLLNLDNIYHSIEDRNLNWEEMISKISSSSIILLGESHTNFQHHQLQAKIIEDLSKLGKKVVVAMEFFERSHNSILQQWSQGQLTEAEFLKETEWPNLIGFNYRYYQPILEVSKKYHLPVIGINIPRSIVHKVNRKGLNNLTEEEKSLFPKVTLDLHQHRYLIQRIFGEFAISSPAMFENMYAAQCVWDTAMASSIQKSLGQFDANTIFVVIVGSGHVIYNLGIPFRLKELGISNWTSVIFQEIETTLNNEKSGIDPHFKQLNQKEIPNIIISRSLAHWIIGTKTSEFPDFPSLGIKLQYKNQQLEIIQVSPESIASQMGWSKGDILISLNNKTYDSLTSAQLDIIYLNWDDKIYWKIKRGEEILSGEKILSVKKE